MDWEKVGIEKPVENEFGKRPTHDDEGTLRPTEHIPYEPLKDLEFMVNSMTDQSERMWLTAVLDNIGGRGSSGVLYATDFAIALDHICRRFITGIRLEGQQEAKGEEAARSLAKALDYDDAVVLLTWLRRKCSLEAAKKKNWRRQFGLGT